MRTKEKTRKKNRWDSADLYLASLEESLNPEIDCYDVLAVAIITQAIKDHAGKDFFTSDWYDILTTNLPGLRNGERIYNQVKENYDNGCKHGLQFKKYGGVI